VALSDTYFCNKSQFYNKAIVKAIMFCVPVNADVTVCQLRSACWVMLKLKERPDRLQNDTVVAFRISETKIVLGEFKG